MKELEIKLLKYDMYFLCFTCFALFVGLALLFADNQNQENRLNEHKKVIILLNEKNNILNEKMDILFKLNKKEYEQKQ